MAKAGIKFAATSSAPGVLVINEKESGDALLLKKGYEASYTYDQGNFANGSFVRVAVKRHPLGHYYAGGNLKEITCTKYAESDFEKEGDLVNDRKGIIVVKNPDAIVGHPATGGGNHTQILSNSAEKGDFVTYSVNSSTGVVTVTGILTNCI